MTPQEYERLTELFHAALEIASDERGAFLDQVSEGDKNMRRELESLLDVHEQRAAYTEKPPADIAAGLYYAQQDGGAADVNALAPNTRFDRYEIRSLLGKGGMGKVYLAEDMRLHRQIALKILPAAVAAEQDRMRRFEQEAQAAAGISHPYVAQVFEVGEHNGTHFIAMEFVDGVTLRAKIHTERADLLKLLKYLQQTAEGLAKAHAAGIVHRDLKPDNIMITRDDYAKILDFGLVKLIEPQRELGPANDASREADSAIMAHHSLAGMVMGTPGYMSPEQAQGKVELIDHRSDIFSFGCVLFEAVTGQKPFADESVSKSLHNVVFAAAPLIKDFNPSAPPDLQRIVRRCLAKDRGERYQTIKDLALELKEVRQRLAGPADLDTTMLSSGTREMLGRPGVEQSTRSTLSAGYVLTQIKRHKRSAAITLVALVIAAAALAFFSYFRHKRAPALTEQDTILIADFENKTGDEIFDGTLKQGLAVQLGQSPFLNLFPDARVRDTLELMKRSPDERVTSGIGREICQRQGLKALIAGSIAPLGSHYVVTLSAINCNSGEVVAGEQTEAENKEQVLKALSQAASSLREKLGESLSSIQKFDAPLKATTSSLEALKAFSVGTDFYNRDDKTEAIRYYRHAVEIDPDFALAYMELAFSYANLDQSGLAAQFAEKAFALGDRVSERERLTILDAYYWFVTGEVEKRIDEAELRTRLYPNDASAFTNLASGYAQLGQYEKSLPESRKALHLNPNSVTPYSQLGIYLIRLNRFAEAREIYDRALKQNLDFTSIHDGTYQIAFVTGDTALMQQQLGWAKGKLGEYDWQTAAAAFGGQWRVAQEFSRGAIERAMRSDAKEVVAGYAVDAALRSALFGQCTQTRTRTTQALALQHHRLVGAHAVLALALCGETSHVQRLIDELVKQYPKDTRINSTWVPAIQAAIELKRGNAANSVAQLQPASRYEAAAEFWPQYLRGLAYLRLRRGADAAVEFEKIRDHRGEAALSVLYPLAHLGLARAAVLDGDTAKAHQSYRDFFALWKDADPDLPVLIEAKKEYRKLK